MSKLGSTIKIHFVTTPMIAETVVAPYAVGARYALFSFFNHIKLNKKTMELSIVEDKPPAIVAKRQCEMYKHTIMDSGLFTLMFGANKGMQLDLKFFEKYQDLLAKFVRQNQLDCDCVELDVQKILGVEEAWYLRERMKSIMPSNTIINVHHMEDGKEGLDKLIEFSDYIAISVPELRLVNPKGYKNQVYTTAKYIKKKKPEIDIHLLGCTEKSLLQACGFCTSADSSAWASPIRFGWLGKNNINKVDMQQYRVKFENKAQLAKAEFNLPNFPERREEYYHKVILSAYAAYDKYCRWTKDQS